MSTPAKAPSKRANRPKGPNRGQARTKIVVRRLPANLPEHVFVESTLASAPESALDRPMTWVAGKVSKNPVKGNTFARAYLYFKSEKLALEFQKAYHGHAFVDKHGNEGRAYVEFSPFQKIPRDQRKPDPKQGTIEEDPDYKAFLESLNADPTEGEKEMKLSGTELLLKENAANPKSTPLLEALRAQKAAAQAAKLAARQARQSGKAGISNAGKAQITILANRNAKDAGHRGNANASANKNQPSASAIKNQQNQARKQAPAQGTAQEADNANAKPKRERKRRDRASKKNAAEGEKAAPSNGSDSNPPQITLLKPKPVTIMSKPLPAVAGSNQDTSKNPSTHGTANSGQRKVQQQQLSSMTPQSSNQQNAGGTTHTANPTGPIQAGSDVGSTRASRSRRSRGEKAKQDQKAGAGPGANTPGNTPGNSQPAGGSKGPAPAKAGRSRRSRGGGGGGGGGDNAPSGSAAQG